MTTTIGPPNQSWLDTLGSALGQGGSEGIQQGLQQFQQKKKSQEDWKGIGSLMKSLGMEIPTEDLDTISASGLSPEQGLPLIIQHQKNQASQKQAQVSKQEGYRSSLDKMHTLIDEGRVGKAKYVQGILDPRAREDLAEFQSLGISLLGLVQDRALKTGIRNKREFDEFIKKTIPTASDTLGTLRGKVNALEEYLNTGEIDSTPRKEGSSSQVPEEVETTTVLMFDRSGKLKKVDEKQAKEAIAAGYTLSK